MNQVAEPKGQYQPQYPDLPRLAKALQRAQGEFALFFVECNLPSLRHELADKLARSLPSPPLRVDLSLLDLSNIHLQLDEVISLQASDAPPDAAIFLFGLEQLLPTLSHEKLLTTVQQLNWRRGSFARLQRPLVVWLPRYALNLLAEQAPDFYDWYSGVFIFPADQVTQQQEESATFQALWNTGIHAGDYSSQEEKRRWLRTLKSLLDDHQQPDTTRASLLGNAGYLLKGLGDYEQALNYLNQSLAIRQEIGDKSGEGTTLNNMATTAHARGDYDTALNYLKQSLAIQQEIGDVAGLCATLFNMRHIHLQNKEVNEAIQAWVTVYGIAKKNQSGSGTGSIGKTGGKSWPARRPARLGNAGTEDKQRIKHTIGWRVSPFEKGGTRGIFFLLP